MTARIYSWKRIGEAVARVVGTPVAHVVLLVLRLSGRKAGIALMYHAVDEQAGDAGRELVPAVASSVFEGQIRHLKRRYRVVRAGDLPAAIAERRRGERYPVAITFDDDLRCHVAVALPILERVGVLATFFLTGVSLVHPFSFWWERLQRALDQGVSNLAELVGAADVGTCSNAHELVMFVQQLGPESRATVEARLAGVAGIDPPDAGLRAADVRKLVEAQMEVGFHTLRHDNLSLLSDDMLAKAMEDGRGSLEEVVGGPLQIICYPYGYVDERVANAARVARFVSGFTTKRVAVTPGSDPLQIGRWGPSANSPGALAAQLVVALVRRGTYHPHRGDDANTLRTSLHSDASHPGGGETSLRTRIRKP
ncbi:MAG: polysaccharide deacetylase family protein [Actinobacteria bacterium]|nr:polysaccharide deacetylase family protein [Actinomycetota bacterium]